MYIVLSVFHCLLERLHEVGPTVGGGHAHLLVDLELRENLVDELGHLIIRVSSRHSATAERSRLSVQCVGRNPMQSHSEVTPYRDNKDK